MKPKLNLFLHYLLSAATLAFTISANAGTHYWDTDEANPGFGTASGTWGTSAFWSVDSTGSTTTANTTITTADDVNFGTATTGLGAGTVTGPLPAQGFLNMTFGSASGAIVLSTGALDLDATTGSTITVNNASSSVSTVLQGSSGKLIKAGSGTLTLSGTHTYSGNTTISEGKLSVASNLIASSPTINIGNGATLEATGGVFSLAANQSITGTGTTGFATTTNVASGVTMTGTNTISSSGTLTFTRLSATGTTSNQITGGNIESGSTGTSQRGILVGSGANGSLTITNASLLTKGTTANSSFDIVGNGAGFTGTLNINNGGSYTNNAAGKLSLGNTNASGILNINSGGSATISEIDFIAGASASATVNLNTGGTLTLSKITSTSGTRTINFDGGQFIAGAALPAFSNVTLNVKDGGAKIQTDYNFTISGALLNSGTGGLTKTGSGALSLGGASTYTGETKIDVGTLNVGGTLASAITVAPNAFLGGEGSTTGNVTFNAGSGLIFDPATTSTNQHFRSTGTIDTTAGATSKIKISLAASIPSGTGIVVMQGTNLVTNGASDFQLNSRGTLTTTPTQVLFDYTAGNLVWKGSNGTNPSFWDVNTTPANFTLEGSDNFYFDGDFVTFEDTAMSYNVAVQGASVSPGSVTFNNSNNNYTLSGGAIAGGGSLTKNGSATVTLGNANTYTGATTVTAGTLSLTGTLSGTSGITVASGATFTQSAAGVISGAAGLTTSGTTTLSGANTYTGITTINGGTLSANTVADTGSSSIGLSAAANALTFGASGGTLHFSGTTGITKRAITFTGGGVFNIDNTKALTVGTATTTPTATDGAWSGSGGVTKSGLGTLSIRNNGAGGSRFAVDSLRGGTFTMQQGTLNIIPSLYFTIGDGSSTGTSTFSQSGGTANFTPVTNSTGSDVYIGNASSAGQLLVTGGSFNVTTSNSLIRVGQAIAGTLSIGGGAGTATVDSPAVAVGVGAGNGIVNLYANGVLLTSALRNSAGAGTSTVNFDGGTLKAKTSSGALFMPTGFNTAAITANGLTVDTNTFDVTIAQSLSGSGGSLTKSNAGTLTLTNTNSYTGNTTVTGGTLKLGNVVANTSLADASTVTIAAGAVLELDFPTGPVATDTVKKLYLGTPAVQVPAGVYDASTPTYGSYFAGTGSLTVTDSPVVGGYASWAAAKGLDGTPGKANGPTDDPEYDGIENLLEYVLNGNPLASDMAILPTQSIVGTNFVFSFTRRIDSAADTTQSYESSTNLSDWTSIAPLPIPASTTPGTFGAITVGAVTGTPPNEVQAITITVPKGANTKLFGRLNVTP